MPLPRAKRNTSRGIIIHDGAVLLIERWRTDKAGHKLHYFSIPGGKIEDKEIPELTVVRELYEEARLLIRPSRLLAKQTLQNGRTNFYYLCQYLSGGHKPQTSPTEKQTKTNRSEARWIKLNDLSTIELNEIYEPVRKLIVSAFQNSLPETPLQIK